MVKQKTGRKRIVAEIIVRVPSDEDKRLDSYFGEIHFPDYDIAKFSKTTDMYRMICECDVFKKKKMEVREVLIESHKVIINTTHHRSGRKILRKVANKIADTLGMYVEYVYLVK